MYKSYLLIILGSMLGLLSCTEEQIKRAETDSGEALVVFRVNTPTPNSQVRATRAGTVANQAEYENQISDILVLTFHNGRMTQVQAGTSVTSTSTSTVFKASVRASNSPIKIYLIANSGLSVQAVGTALYNKTPEEVRQSISAVTPSIGVYGTRAPFVMWGEIDQPSGLTATAPGVETPITGVQMVRATARAVITKAVDDATLKVTSARIYRMNDKMAVIPTAVNSQNTVSAPTIPVGTAPMVPISGLDVSETPAPQFPLTYYLTESAAAPSADAAVTQATCIVIGGYFGGSSVETYYRIDFEKDTDSNGKADVIGEILRNHTYSFNIVSVKSPGWSTPDEAALNRPSSLTVEVNDWNDEASQTTQNKEYSLTTTAREIVLQGSTGSSNYLEFTTSETSIAPSIIFDNQQISVGGSHSNSRFTVALTGTGSGQYRLTVTALLGNTGGTSINEEVVIKYGTLSVPINLRQIISAYLEPNSSFIWVTSDGSNPTVNLIKSSHSWRVDASGTTPWLHYTVYPDSIKVWGDANHNRTIESRTGTLKLINDANAVAYVTVKQVRWIEWSAAYLRGGPCLTTPSRTITTDFDRVPIYIPSPQGTRAHFAATSQDVGVLRHWIVGQSQPTTFSMKGDFYLYPALLTACQLVNTATVKWKIPSPDELVDWSLRAVLSSNLTYYVTNPDGTVVYFPQNGITFTNQYTDGIVTHLPSSLLLSNGTTTRAFFTYGKALRIWNIKDLPLRCVRDYN